jgi:predicted nucleic acid-binding protein
MPLVVDASVALSWALPDESSVYADAVLAIAERDGVRVPELWAREVANGLAVAYRRKRMTSDDEGAFLAALSRLSISVEQAPPPQPQFVTEPRLRFGMDSPRMTRPMSTLPRAKD